ncbi:MAG TPA: DUF2341 domain-containing protein, partial [Thermoplasmata archaeon]|nr:DUF2341 domain-containing protein [Thermoplasmata archaeon]
TLDLTSSTNLRLTRALTGSQTADVGWFVVEFGTVTTGSLVAGIFPTDVQTTNNVYAQYRETNPSVDHTFVEVTTVQSTTSDTYVDIPGATIGSSSFTAGRKYLLVFTAQVASPLSASQSAYIQTVHGSTLFSGSEFSFRTDDTAARYGYYWFTVWTAVSGEGVKLQHHIEGNTVRVDTDQITMFKLDLGDLTENTDWSFNENTAGDTIAGTTWDGLASATFTPSAATNWLVMTTMRGDPDAISVNYESRIARSGEATETQPLTTWEGNAVTNDRYVQTLARVFPLTAASNTFTQESRCDAACTYPRSYSSVFALNLNKFEDSTSSWTEAPIALSTTNFATQVQTAGLTPTRAANVWVLGQFAVDVDAAGNFHRFRLQVDNVDQPGTQTSDAYGQWENWDAKDEVVSAIQTVGNLAVAAHTFDLDASREGTTANAEDRMIFAVSMVLAGAYKMEVRYDWSGIATGSAAYSLKIEAHHTAGEDFLVQVLTPPSTWATRITITKTTDDDSVQTYTLTTAEFNAGAPSIRFVGNSDLSDPTSSDLYVDYAVVASVGQWDRIILMRSSDTSGSTWGAQIILASGRSGDAPLLYSYDSAEPSIAIDASGYLHVVWVSAGSTGDQQTLNRVRYTKTTVAYPTQVQLATGANWESITVVDDASLGYMPTVSTDTSNNPHVAWSGSKTSGTVYYKNQYGGSWKPTVSLGTAYTGLSVDVSPQNNHVSLAMLGGSTSGWWDGTYAYRQRITVTAASASLPTGYSVSVTLNHASLVSAGKSLLSGDDVRTVYWSGSAWTELDRILGDGSAWNIASTTIWLKTQAAIGASSSDDNYYLYYGNAAATSPPTNKANVYLFFDGFEAGNLNKWTLTDGGLWQVATDQARAGTYSLKYPEEASTTRHIVANPVLDEPNVYFEAGWRFSSTSGTDVAQIFRRQPSAVSSYETVKPGNTNGWGVAKEIDGTWSWIAFEQGTPVANTWTRIGIAIYGTGMRVFKDGTQINPASGTVNVGTEMASGNIGFRKWSIGTGFAWWIDDVIVRRYADPEPTTGFSSEEANTNEIRYMVCKDLAATSCDASGEFTTWSGTAGYDVVATAVEGGGYPSLATTYEANGDLWVAYAKDVGGTTRAVYARFLDYPSGGFSAVETVDSLSGTQFTRPTIGLDKDGNVHALYVALSGPQLDYKMRTGSWGARTAVDSSGDSPSLMVRAPNDATFGVTLGAVYWKSSTSETYFYVPEFESVAVPVLGAILLGLVFRRRARRHRGSLPHDRPAAPPPECDEGDVPRQ